MTEEIFDAINEEVEEAYENAFFIALRNHCDLWWAVSEVEDMVDENIDPVPGVIPPGSYAALCFFRALCFELHTSIEEMFRLSNFEKEDIVYQMISEAEKLEIIKFNEANPNYITFDVVYRLIDIHYCDSLSSLPSNKDLDNDCFGFYRLQFVKISGNSYSLFAKPISSNGAGIQSKYFISQALLHVEKKGRLTDFIEKVIAQKHINDAEDDLEESYELSEKFQYDTILHELGKINP